MNLKQLKVGDSVDLVRPLTDGGYDIAFDTTRTTIGDGEEFVGNTDFYRNDFCKKPVSRPINHLTLDKHEIKLLGKLTITKLK